MDIQIEGHADLKKANAEFTSFHEILIKQEPLDQHCPETGLNVQGSLFNVVKQEICDDRSEVDHSRDNSVDATVAGTHCVVHIKSEPVEVETSFSTDTLNKDNSQPASDHDAETKADDNASKLTHLLTEYNITCHRCNICDYQCAYRSVLKKHIQNIHAVDKPYRCKHCDYKSSNASYFNQHMKIHTRKKLKVAYIKPEPVQAEVTLPPNTSKLNMDNSQYTTDRDAVVTANDDTYTLKHLLTEYNIECHQCSVCNYQCAYSSVLKRHMSIHTGVKPYCCKLCDFKCTRASYLKQHMKIHTREKLANHVKMVTRSQTNKNMNECLTINVKEQDI